MAGKCKYCSCDMSKVLSPFDVCSADPANWGQMIEDAREYWAMRQQFPVVITARYPKEEQAEAAAFNDNVLEKYRDANGNLDIKAALLDLKPAEVSWEEFISRTRALGFLPVTKGAWVRSKEEPGTVVFDPDVQLKNGGFVTDEDIQVAQHEILMKAQAEELLESKRNLDKDNL